ncbi:permease [Halocatena pleomorpha]|uniref:Permease n=1 Tax=Halocatena pleomorpha TaxID=1785090 RepID=A0A3P3RMK0_9EURY|nr:permease [Halocatena pleomorpha]RRJ34079.1 permease [Halocatena pleomorpha]
MIPPGIEASLLDSGTYFLHLLLVILPLFILASFLVGILQEYAAPDRLEAVLRGRDEGTGNVAAAFLGSVTPFCSCSSLPVAAGLLQSGAPLGIVFSFLIASPLINEIAITLLIGLFGLEIMLLYVGAMFAAAVCGGIILGRLNLEDHIKDTELLRSVSNEQPMMSDGGTLNQKVSVTHSVHFKRAASQAWEFFKEMLPYALFGLAVAAIIHGLVPIEWLLAILGPQNPLAVPLAVLAGVPLYLDVTAMLPIAASLVDKGIPLGTVLALLVGVVAISLPELIMLNKLFERQLLVVYMTTVVVIGISGGVLFNMFPL